MTRRTAEVVICGAGIAGVAAAYQLVVEHGVTDVVIVEEGAPLSLTSDKSTECYRNWWPGPDDTMVAFMNRSIDLLETLAGRCQNRFGLNRRGYLFVTGTETGVRDLERSALESTGLGAGELRRVRSRADYQAAPTRGFEDQPDGADLVADADLVRELFPYLSADARAVLHARRCGWMSAQQLGMVLLEGARDGGARLLTGRLAAVSTAGGRVTGVRVDTASGVEHIDTPVLVNAAGPHLGAVGRLMEVVLPVYAERHVKLAFDDRDGAIPRDAPMLIWNDPTFLPWTDEERELLAADDETAYLTEAFPAGVHGRPEGAGSRAIAYWTIDDEVVEPEFPVTWDPHVPEILMRGMAVMIPALGRYFDHLPRPYIDGGYYSKTRENRPLIGPLPLEGGFVCGAYSGFGIMASCAGGELLAAHVTGSALPGYAAALSLTRYDDPDYEAGIDQLRAAQGQL